MKLIGAVLLYLLTFAVLAFALVRVAPTSWRVGLNSALILVGLVGTNVVSRRLTLSARNQAQRRALWLSVNPPYPKFRDKR